MAESIYDDPPPAFRYSLDFGGGSWYLPDSTPAARPSRVTYTPSGPMAVGALPDGFEYDLYGNPVYTDGNGVKWSYDEEGNPAKIQYGASFVTGAVGAAAGPIQSTPFSFIPPTKEELDKDLVPQALKAPRMKDDVQRAVSEKGRASEGPFGVTSPGGVFADRPARMGGPLNDPAWLGSDLIREQAAAQNPDWSSQQVDDYVRSYTVRRSVNQAAKQFQPKNYDPKTMKGTYYQRFAYDQAMQAGFGRPQYGAGSEYAVLNMNPTALIELQQAMIQAQIPGSSSIVIGHVGDLSGDDSTLMAYRNALSAANLAGMPIKEYLSRQMQISRLAERAALKDGSPGDPKFDPTRVQTSVNLTGRARARAQLRQMMANMLGRMPSESEVDEYLNRLNAQEKADPTVRTTTYTRSGDSSSVTEATDVDPAMIAEREVKGDNPKEYQAYQRLNYYNVMLQLMDGGA